MKCLRLLLFIVFMYPNSHAQVRTLKGRVIDAMSNNPIPRLEVYIENSDLVELTNVEGHFSFKLRGTTELLLVFSAESYLEKRLPIELDQIETNLGTIALERDVLMEKQDHLIELSEAALENDVYLAANGAYLQANRDVFLNRAAFDFGQAFFRIRGYDSQNSVTMINNLPMNNLVDGRPTWNRIGGLNDITRNQVYSHGLGHNSNAFGGILGTSNILIQPSKLRSGMRFSSSVSNRSYAGRIMATYSSGKKDSGLAYTFSTSRRWAKEGFIDGSVYDAYSIFMGLEYQFSDTQRFGLAGILAVNKRGRSSAYTEEVKHIQGIKYNPNWGIQNGSIRNSRIRDLQEPILLFNHYYETSKIKLTSGIAFQFGTQKNSRLGYYNAPNPDPTYYRYLPSFYINSPIGANFTSANVAMNAFKRQAQLNWNSLYEANSSPPNNGAAAYLLYNDTAVNEQWAFNHTANLEFNSYLTADLGFTYLNLTTTNYAKISDLLGADRHLDIDPFSETRNDINSPLEKYQGSIFNYHYALLASNLKAFAQINYQNQKLGVFLGTQYDNTSYEREGFFLNERFPDNSMGKSEKIQFYNFGIKAGLTYDLSGRHRLTTQAAYLTRAPILKNSFINPRENNLLVPELNEEKIYSIDFNYYVRYPKLIARLSSYYTRFQNTTDINFFFVDSGLGSDFVQEVITELDKLHMGIEAGIAYDLAPSVQLTAVASIGKYLYASSPNVTINFDTAGADEELINVDGNVDLGVANLKDHKLAQGPQHALSIGLSYRDPTYWWAGFTANYLAKNYINLSSITRTKSFILDPASGEPFPQATEENVHKLLKQNPLEPSYLLNVIGGKSWLINSTYVSLFFSLNNLFDLQFKTGGYEQSRNGNYGQLGQDNLSGNPSFGPKYWFGYGRTYFINLAFNF